MKILLTGATGFLGNALAKHWAQAGHQLTLLVRPTSSLRRVDMLRPKAQTATCTNDDDVVQLVLATTPDVIVHTACVYGRQGETALQVFDANVRLGMLLLEGVLKANDARVSFINTSTVLGPTVSNYALSKQQFSQWGDALAKQHPAQLQFVNLLLQHMFGPGDDIRKFACHVTHACFRHQPQLALTAGDQRRDFIFIDDVVTAYDVVIHKLSELAGSDQVDVGSGLATTVRKFVEQVHALTGTSTELQFGAVPYRVDEPMLCQANTEKLRRLGWCPSYSLEQGIQRTLDLDFKSLNLDQ